MCPELAANVVYFLVSPGGELKIFKRRLKALMLVGTISELGVFGSRPPAVSVD